MSIDNPTSAIWPKVSIITPSFNQAPYLDETIRSVLFQQYPNLEYIIIDGGSVDGSVEIIRKYEHLLDYWESEPDNGQSHAINKGLARATGEIIAWLNSDDFYMPGAVQRAVQALVKHDEVGLVHGVCLFVDENSHVVGETEENARFNWQGHLTKNLIAQPSAFFRRSALDKAGPLNESLEYMMDFDLWLRIAQHSKIHYLATPQANFRIWSQSKTALHKALFGLEWINILDTFYARPDVPLEAISVKKFVYGYVYWAVGNTIEESGKFPDGIALMTQAIEKYGLLDGDLKYAETRLLYDSSGALRSEPRLKAIIDSLPSDYPGVSEFSRRVWSEHHATICYLGRKNDEPLMVRRHWFRAVQYSSRWLMNIGFLKQLLWAYKPANLSATGNDKTSY